MSGSSDEPIQFREIGKLTNLGINQQFINFNHVSLESDKYCSVKEPGEGTNTFRIVDLTTKKVDPHTLKADAVLNHPSARVLAVRSKNKVQVRNLEMDSATGNCTMTEDIVFWKWIDRSMLALITETAVYHWSLEQGDSKPKKIFDRAPELESSQIINYRCDPQKEWCCLSGLSRDGDKMKGNMQLFSRARNASQYIEGHASAFVDFKIHGTNDVANVLCIATARADGGKLFLRDVSGNTSFENKSVDIQFQAGDFPVSMQASSHYGLIYLLTRTGTLTVYDVRTGTMIFGKRLSADPIFVTAPHDDRGFVGVNRAGQVVACTVHEGNFVPFIMNKLQDMKLAFEFAARAGLPGAEELYERRLNQLMSNGDIGGAIKVIQASPNGFLRNQDTIERFKAMAAGPDGKPRVLEYFRTLLETDKLNATESFELASLALQRGPSGVSYLKKLLDEDKIEGSEKLGDLLRSVDREMALKLYARGNAGGKVIEGLIESGQYDNVFKYCERENYQPDWLVVLRNVMQSGNADGAEKLATILAEKGEIDPNKVATLFVQAGFYQQVTSFLIEVLKDDREEQAELQTRLLEITLTHCPPNITEGIFANDMLSHFDKNKIGKMCEQKQLYARALECFTEIDDIKRVMIHSVHMLDPNWLIKFFGHLDVEDCLLCFQELLKRNIRQNLQLVVGAAKAYCAQIGTHKLIELFDNFKSPEGMFHFLRGIVPMSDDPEVHFRYIEAAVRVGNMGEVERMTHDSNLYDPERTKEFLKEARLSNMWPLINVCDKHGFIQELVEYLYNNSQLKYVDAYVQQRSPQNAPQVIGALLDVDCNEDHILSLLQNVGPLCPIAELCEQVEDRNRLKLILPWLEARYHEDVEEPPLHNALAKIYIDMNKDAQRFLEDNPFYDSVVVGKYCERRDPLLAFVAYKRGQCDDELVALTNKNSMYRQQATYLTERKDLELWGKVLVEENTHRQMVVDQVIQTALPESRDPDEVSVTVKAFMLAKLPNQLIELLEKLVLHGSSNFRSNRNLQNLLILTAVNSDQSRVMGYVQQLDNYEPNEVASICHKSDLFEEAFFVYKKHDKCKEAINVLMVDIVDLDRAQEYADRVDIGEVHSMLGSCQLEHDRVKEAIASYMKAEDPNDFNMVIDGVNRVQDFHADLIKYLLMCRKKIKDNNIDTEIVYSFARINKLAEMEDFINIPNQLAKVQQVGDRCYAEGMYEAAKILFTQVGNHAKLASTLLKLHDYPAAYDAAKKANSIRTWKEVAIACIDAQQYQLAHMAALNIVVSADHMDEIIHHYESRGLFEEVIHLLEVGLSMEKAHREMFTELGVLYAKYKPEKLMEHIRIFSKKVNTSKLIRACETHHHWKELRYLYSLIDEHDNAVRVMIDHSPVAWEHTTFKEQITQVRNLELYYRSVSFYLDERPDLLVDLLASLASRIDHARVVNEVRRSGHLPLIKRYMESVQPEDNKTVNENLNSLYVEEGEYEKLRSSVDRYGTFDQISLAQRCEKMPLLEFRRIAAHIYKKNERYHQSIELSKNDKLYQDAMETASDSGNEELAEELLIFFVDIGQKECFAACLFTCYNLIKADMALELGWRHNIMDFTMPFLVQWVRQYADKVDGIIRERKAEKEQQKAEKEEQDVVEQSSAMPVVVDPVMVQLTGQPANYMNMQYTGGVPGMGMGGVPFMSTGY